MLKISISILTLGLLVACNEVKVKETPNIADSWTKDNSSDLGKNIAIQEEIDIKLFLERHRDWEMTTTGSGLQYFVYKEGDGDTVKRKDLAEVEYSITLLDGTVCYLMPPDEYVEVRVDQSEVENGLQEALKLMRVGDKMKVIIPSHIGHGILGDMDKIPPLTTLVVDIHLLGMK